MNTNVSFGSMFNPERISRKSIESLSDPEYNIEGLRRDVEQSKYFPAFPSESLGRSQVQKTNVKNPHKLELSNEDEKFLSKLSSTEYGFHGSSNDFWFHSRKPNSGSIPNLIMGDGALQKDETRHDFIKKLVNSDTQAFQIAGIDKLGGNKLITVVRNSETGTLTMYTCDSKQCYPMVLDNNVDIANLAEAIADNLDKICGSTIWKN